MRYRLVGPVALITTGVLFLLDEFTRWDWDRTWPILLIAIGVALVLQRTLNPPETAFGAPAQMPPAAPGSETSSEKR